MIRPTTAKTLSSKAICMCQINKTFVVTVGRNSTWWCLHDVLSSITQSKTNRTETQTWFLIWGENWKRFESEQLFITLLLVAKCSTFDRSHKGMSFVPMPKKFQEFSNCCTLARVKLEDLTSKTLICRWGTKMTLGLGIRSSKATNLCRSDITCRRRARCVRSLCGTCSVRQLLTNANGELWNLSNSLDLTNCLIETGVE